MSEINKCESPIERKFFAAWKTLISQQPASHWGIFTELGPDKLQEAPESIEYNYWIHHCGADYLFVQPKIGKYRVDFAIGRISAVMGESVTDTALLIKLPVVIVECDGHDFHEVTKKQAAADKSRDRELQCRGYRVMRFTGSEIHKDAHACVMAVYKLFDRMERDILKHPRRRNIA